jgi:chemotaxis protein CheD
VLPERLIGAHSRAAEPRAASAPGDDRVVRRTVHLQPGQVFASAEPTSVVTILGSCVAVCLFDPVARVGGMNHYLLPLFVQRERSPRFGNVALALLLDQVLLHGARKVNLSAKVFGGAGVLDGFQRSGRSLGHDNVELALRTLEAEGIPILDGDVGGRRGRRLVFHVDDGSAWVKPL